MQFFTLHHLFIPSTPASWILHFPSTNQATLCLNHPAEDVKSETFSSSPPPPTPAQILRCVFTFLKESSCCIILKSAFVDGGGGRRVGETTPGQKKSPWSRRWESPRRWAQNTPRQRATVLRHCGLSIFPQVATAKNVARCCKRQTERAQFGLD